VAIEMKMEKVKEDKMICGNGSNNNIINTDDDADDDTMEDNDFDQLPRRYAKQLILELTY
jgi:hypothetical protein